MCHLELTVAPGRAEALSVAVQVPTSKAQYQAQSGLLSRRHKERESQGLKSVMGKGPREKTLGQAGSYGFYAQKSTPASDGLV